MAFYPVMFFMN